MGVDHAGIEGGGTIDGQGPGLKAKQHPYAMRPFLVRWVRSSNVTLRDVHLIHPGAWTLNFYHTNGALVDAVTIRSRGLGLHKSPTPTWPALRCSPSTAATCAT